MRARIAEVLETLPWLVHEEDGRVLGFAYASRWKGRCAYRFAAESTVYVADGHARRGIGRALYTALLSDLRARGVHCVIGGIAQPNPASVALHEALGFSKVAHFREVGWKFGRWIDVGYWEVVLGAGRGA
jgi:phosphinothricin acetyltransferase